MRKPFPGWQCQMEFIIFREGRDPGGHFHCDAWRARFCSKLLPTSSSIAILSVEHWCILFYMYIYIYTPETFQCRVIQKKADLGSELFSLQHVLLLISILPYYLISLQICKWNFVEMWWRCSFCGSLVATIWGDVLCLKVCMNLVTCSDFFHFFPEFRHLHIFHRRRAEELSRFDWVTMFGYAHICIYIYILI